MNISIAINALDSQLGDYKSLNMTDWIYKYSKWIIDPDKNHNVTKIVVFGSFTTTNVDLASFMKTEIAEILVALYDRHCDGYLEIKNTELVMWNPYDKQCYGIFDIFSISNVLNDVAKDEYTLDAENWNRSIKSIRESFNLWTKTEY